ncbi:MAG TPA: glycosyltransferase [Pirellulales bacterium]|nr:glycosyltransferase [Pirellulales bacterium]
MTADASSPIRLALCITDLDIGGAEQRFAELAVRLDRREFLPEIYALGPRPADPLRSIVPRLEAAGLAVHCLNARSAADAPAVTRRLALLLKRQRAEVLLSFLYHANLLGRVAASWAGVPRVACGIRVAERRSRWRLRLDRWTSRWVDAYVVVSESVAAFSRTEGGLPGDRLQVIPNGIDVGRFDQAAPADLTEFGIGPGRRAVTFVGRLDPQKGLAEFLSAASAWLDPLPDCDFLLVGAGPQREELERLVQQRGLSQRVRFAGWRADIPSILRASALLVLPSLWEGMPNVLLEAMACRLPVVATNVEGVGELLGPQSEAQTAPIGDMQTLAAKIVAIASQAELAARLGQSNRHRVESQFSLDAMVAAYSDLLHRLAGRS